MSCDRRCYEAEEGFQQQGDCKTCPGRDTEGSEPHMPRMVSPDGYRARNLDVATCYGLNAGLCSIKDRMAARKDCPLWLLEKLDDMINRSDCLIRPLVQHRDELSPR